ncbi:pyroglutamyl-peptidase I [Bacillus cytotoxicus]|uniref:Pyrrolidone-carboxylate peptidase n=2 Tax=Bacillus cytotoxicus TaxID=580165 RepID=PCP_BACCN|nr:MULTISPECIES: pyroglutamyl-peptidase I [Bacillus cereus group]A7GQB6.1 RecName: Full=Pyrrolidone-carboxylate peptidase; AltName: Full=5-oxoprolyl-peptidase; AltName: Full=Pyroglutamyl-peptidase I; Short=PGP-I; Short=Pyrase [Bacillus cytotoxicus NVH 391-98]ABS22324.1 pyrrolidone-carboxylate peptidase [Bacillus cytotoxicus NVH 391-98]AWC28934.1 pyroglutamyl-peptidase I [Bacillus cytotoxicus]AWC32929.1 pyroglutamyl-peptidase I [Bacillus cytotoxicus]AWC36953.1 pyroglutamyl-peptidase I [Bacillus
MKTVLLTGFDPFGGEKINPAWEVAKALHEKEGNGYKVISKQIPTVFHKSIEQLESYIDEFNPELIICIGQAGGRADITVERVAINVDDARIPDNENYQPIDVPIIEDGPVAYWSTLPIKAIVKKLREEGIPASVSQTAGTFVCNHLFYGLMHRLAIKNKSTRGGFVHIPFLPEQASLHANQPSMSLSTIIAGIQLLIEVALQVEKDIVECGGTTH